MKKQKILWIVVFTVLVATLGQMQVLAATRPSRREQLGIKKLPKTEDEVLVYTIRALENNNTPSWKGINKALIRRTFGSAFNRAGKIKPAWAERFHQIAKKAIGGNLSKPVSKGKNKCEFTLRTGGSRFLIFEVKGKSSDPIYVIGAGFHDIFPHKSRGK